MLIVLICLLIPIMSGAAVLMGRQLAKANRRMEQYRASPESHILNLHDQNSLVDSALEGTVPEQQTFIQ
jgi:hypothetical protein